MSVEINVTNEVVEINEVSEIVEIVVSGGIGPAGPAGQGVPIGGTIGQVLGKLSSTNYDTAWISNGVPYTGATTNVDLGEFELKAGQVEFDQTPTGTAGVGVMRWNDTDGTVDLGLKGGNVTLQVGQEQVLRVVNKTGADLLESQYRAVRIRLVSEGGAQGQRLAVVLAQGDNDPDSTTTIGIVTETITNNQEGFITTSGEVRGINTTGSLQGETWADGDILYLSPSVAGGITKVKPTAPDHSLQLGYVVYAHINNGKIFVKVDNGYEIGELHDVYVPTPSNNDGIFWNTANLRYQNNSISGILGYTPQAALTLTTTGSSGAATLTGATLNIPQYAASMAIGGAITSATAGSVLFAGTSGVLQQDNANLFWDDTNNRLGIGTTTPSDKLHISTNTSAVNTTLTLSTKTDTINFITFADTGGATQGAIYGTGSTFVYGTYLPSQVGINGFSGGIGLRVRNTASSSIIFYGGNANTDFSEKYFQLYGNTGNVVIQNNGTFTDNGQRLQVQGTSLLNGFTTISGSTTAASAIARGGLLSSTLVASANSDVLIGLDINPTFTNGGFSGVSNIGLRVGGTSGLNYDIANQRLGIGTNTPLDRLSVTTTASTNNVIRMTSNSSNANLISFRNSDASQQGAFLSTGSSFVYGTYLANQCTLSGGAGGVALRVNNTANINFYGGNADSDFSVNYFRLFAATGNVVIQNGGTFTDSGYRLDVNGTARYTGFVKFFNNDTYFGSTENNGIFAPLTYSNSNYPAVETNSIGVVGGIQGVVNTVFTVATKITFQIGTGVNSKIAQFSPTTGNFIIQNGGTFTDNASALIQMNSTSKGFLPPRMTTTERNAIGTPAAGLIVYDTTLNKLCVRTASAWETITSI